MPRLTLLLSCLLIACPGSSTKDETGDTGDTGDTEDTGDSPLSSSFVEDLSEQGGCSDFVLWARNAEDTLVLVLWGEGAAHAAHVAGETIEHNGTIEPEADGLALQSVQVWQGEHISQSLCTDNVEETPIFERTWEGEGGSYTLSATPSGEAAGGEEPTDVTLQIQGVELSSTDAQGSPVVMDEITLEANIGWHAGG